MRILFVHDECPGQFKHGVAALAADPANRVVFLARKFTARPRGVECRSWVRQRPFAAAGHPYLQSLHSAVSAGEAAYDACVRLEREGFRPDVICAHAGFGPGLYLKEVFPDVPVLGYFEWLYRGPGQDSEYLSRSALPGDVACRARTRNAGILLELASCDAAIAPTEFQRAQFPAPFRDKLEVLHDGIDTEYFKPASDRGENTHLATLPHDAEVLTYATRGMEPMRGFPQFMAAAAALLARRPKLHVLIAGEDRVAYSSALANGRSYREQALDEHPVLASKRVRFLGRLPGASYRDLLRASTAHVYLTAPFVLSWSLLEAMSCGCLIVASDTDPVKEVMSDARHGLLVDFRDPERLARRIAEALDARGSLDRLRTAARSRIVERYEARRLVPRHLALIERLCAQGHAAPPARAQTRVAVAAGLLSTEARDALTTH